MFPTKESLEPFIEQLIPLLMGLADDNSELTRQHAMRAIRCLATVATKCGCFTAERLHKLYFGECPMRICDSRFLTAPVA